MNNKRVHLSGDKTIVNSCIKICVNLRNLRIELSFSVEQFGFEPVQNSDEP
jgi:hypothetical protein